LSFTTGWNGFNEYWMMMEITSMSKPSVITIRSSSAPDRPVTTTYRLVGRLCADAQSVKPRRMQGTVRVVSAWIQSCVKHRTILIGEVRSVMMSWKDGSVKLRKVWLLAIVEMICKCLASQGDNMKWMLRSRVSLRQACRWQTRRQHIRSEMTQPVS
jgi:hypothetical protein